jgi:hypothetical protein
MYLSCTDLVADDGEPLGAWLATSKDTVTEDRRPVL